MKPVHLTAAAAALVLVCFSPGELRAQDVLLPDTGTTEPPPPPAPPPPPEVAPVAFGIQAGADFSNPSINDLGYSSGNWRSGFAGGATLDFMLAPGFAIGTGAYYVQRAARPTFTDIHGVAMDTTWRLDYLVVPLVLKFVFGSGPVRPYLFAGGNVGFSTRARADLGTIFDATGSFDASGAVKSTDWAVEGGAGLRFDVAPHVGITIEGQYSHGLTNIVKGGTTYGAGSWKSRDILALGGLQFGF